MSPVSIATKVLLVSVTLLVALDVVSSQNTGTAGCARWCRHTHNPTEFYCCRADPFSSYHHGRCPQRFVMDSMSHYCRSDRHCQAYEKCCYSTYNNRYACVTALTNRFQPRQPAISTRFGGIPSGVSNNFDDLSFPATYRHGNQGWGNMGDMEPMK